MEVNQANYEALLDKIAELELKSEKSAQIIQKLTASFLKFEFTNC
jgi:hypothetical protein